MTLQFPTFYTAICGRNDAGKTNIVRGLRALVDRPGPPWVLEERHDLSRRGDFPRWLDKDLKSATISVNATFEVSQNDDHSLYTFLKDYLGIPEPEVPSPMELCLGQALAQSESLAVTASLNGRTIEPSVKATEVLNRLRTSGFVIFQSAEDRYGWDDPTDFFIQATETDQRKLDSSLKRLNGTVRAIAKKNQKNVSELLGRLKDQYQLGVTVRDIQLEQFNFDLNLSKGGTDVALANWGGGTQNRTKILVSLFRAQSMRDSSTPLNRFTPILVIEEPESYLHPSAQAEFGRTLQDLSEEFKVQIIVTTHSPYLLSQKIPTANILLERKTAQRGTLRATVQTEVNSVEWMQPFALALGMDSALFKPWKDAIFSQSDTLLMVEGKTDKEYLDLLRDPKHGTNTFRFEGDVIAYGGFGLLQDEIVLKFLKERHKRLIVTCDLDVLPKVEAFLKKVGLVEGKTYFGIGKDISGKRAIEGLLPERISQQVFSENTALVQEALNGTKEEQKSAKGKLKKAHLEKLKAAQFSADDYAELYKLAKTLSKAATTSE